jgi:hypothetical protein
MKVRFFTDYTSSENYAYHIIKSEGLENAKFDITSGDDYDYAVILNTATPALKVPKSNVIGLAEEPKYYLELNDHFISYVKNNVSKYYIGYSGVPEPEFKTHYGFISHVEKPKSTKNYNDKQCIMSLIVSEKQMTQGQCYRHLLVKEIINNNLPIDIYGKSTPTLKTMYNNDTRIKEPFTVEDIHKPYEDYKYHICIENEQHSDYISEKYTTAVLYNSIPVYLGATNVEKYFEKDCCIKLTGDIEKDLELLKNICQQPDNFKIDLSQARYNIEQGKANKFVFLNKIIEEQLLPGA